MRLPAALVPLRHVTFRVLWGANVITSLGLWLQNTGAGWLMTTLSPDPLTVSLVQAATILPMFLLALPAGAIADIVDRRLFLIVAQTWTMLAAALLAVLTLLGLVTAGSLLGLTFAIGVGAAMTAPGWGALVPELVPRQDLVQAISLNGIGFNLARAIGPALAGLLVVVGGSGLTFSLYAASILAVIGALVWWRRSSDVTAFPPEHFLSAMRTGMRFVRNTPAMRAAMVRSFSFSICGAAPWAMLPLVVRDQLGLGAGMYGLILGCMGVGGVGSGLLLPNMRRLLNRGGVVVAASLCSFTGIAVLALSTHLVVACFGMMLFGVGWVAVFSTVQAAAQMVSPSWVRARALAIYQLSFNGALTLGSFGWGWLALHLGLSHALLAAAAIGATLTLLVRNYSIDPTIIVAQPEFATPQPVPEAPADELATTLRATHRHILETMHYRVDVEHRRGFLAAMNEVRQIRGRAGALQWALYEDIAHPEGWMETWLMDNWTDHLREATRLSEADLSVLTRAGVFQRDGETPLPARFLSIDPQLGPA